MVKSLKKMSPSSGEDSQQIERKQVGHNFDEPVWNPRPLNNLADTGLSKLNVADLVLKVLYNGGDMYGHEISNRLKLPFQGVLDGIVEWLKHEQYIDIGGGGGIGEASYRYQISSKGVQKALEAMERTAYAGAAHVPLNDYIASTHAKNREPLEFHR
mgnify:CR=1 FL=1